MKILEKILEELKNNKSVISFLETKPDQVDMHFSLGLYIRNKYLWGNEKNTKTLMQHYKVNHVDDISSRIILDLQKQLSDNK